MPVYTMHYFPASDSLVKSHALIPLILKYFNRYCDDSGKENMFYFVWKTHRGLT